MIPTVNILGVDIAAVNMTWLIKFTCDYIDTLSGEYVCVDNVHTVVMSYEDEEYRIIQNNSIMCIPDGGPLSVIGRKRGAISMERTTGPDYLNEVLNISRQNGWRHFFYGSNHDTLKKIEANILEAYPGIQIVGMISPPYKNVSVEEDERICEKINSVSPDFVWVGLGAPKQEKWMFSHQGRIKGLMVGVGAAFDYYAGNIRRAPIWMQRNNLEWLYRLIQEPRRLFARYFITNLKFIWNVIIKGR